MTLKSMILGATALLLTSQLAAAQSFNQFIAFGDSTLDDGWFRYQACSGNPTLAALCNASKAAGGRIPTTPGGSMNSDLLASYFGLTLTPADAPGGGTNFAASGADDNNRLTNANAPSLVEQVSSYLAGNGGRANGSALYLIQSGGNDVNYANSQFSAGAFTGAQANAYLRQEAGALASSVAQLQAAGARYVVVSNDYTNTGPVGNPSAPLGTTGNDNRKALYIQTMWADLVANGVQFIPADTVSMQKAIFTNPGMFGFTSILNTDTAGGTACINPNPALISDSWSLYCTPALLRSPNAAQTSFFADNAHLSAAAQKIEADYDYSLIVAPSEISYLAEAPVKIRTTVVNTIFNQIPVSLGQIATFHGWVSGDVSSLRINNNNPGFPDDPGVPVSATGGFDYRLSSSWLVGAAFSGGTTRQTFSLGGDFKQQDVSVSAYAAYRNGPYWVNSIATAGWLHDDTNRQVPLGITVQPNYGSTNGTDYSFAAEVGYNFMTQLGARAIPGMPVKAPPVPYYFSTGPLVGIILQQVRIDGFTETDQFASVGGLTALSFAGQLRNSAVSELGWQASYDAGVWKPFVKATWNHEWANTDRDVTASLTTPVAVALGAPAYSLPAVILGKDWGAGAIGTSIDLGRGVTGLAVFNSEFAQRSVTIYGGQLGINVALDSLLNGPVKAILRNLSIELWVASGPVLTFASHLGGSICEC